MATQVQFRGGTTSQHGSFTGAVREVTVDTDKETLVVHDGSTAGGFPMARADGGGVTNFAVGGTLNVTGETTLATHLNLGDSDKIKLGNAGDLEIYHDGSNSYIADEGTGNIIISSGGITFQNQARDETYATLFVNSSVNLYNDNVERFQTSANGIEVLNTASGEEALVRIKAATNGNSAIAFGDTGNVNVGKIDYNHADNSFAFDTNSTERLRILSTGQVLVGLTGRLFYNHTGTINTSIADDSAIKINRSGGDGNLIAFGKDGTQMGSIATIANDLRIFSSSSNHSGLRMGSNQILPTNNAGADSDNTADLGDPGVRFDDVFATNGTINTSDRNEKQDIEELSDAEKRVGVVAKGLMRKFRWKDAVAEKGDNARTHFGIIAQDLQDAFTAESLDASKYAMFCSDTWWEKEISVDATVEHDDYTYMDTKQEATTGYTEKTRLGVRYSELLAFIISAI